MPGATGEQRIAHGGGEARRGFVATAHYERFWKEAHSEHVGTAVLLNVDTARSSD